MWYAGGRQTKERSHRSEVSHEVEEAETGCCARCAGRDRVAGCRRPERCAKRVFRSVRERRQSGADGHDGRGACRAVRTEGRCEPEARGLSRWAHAQPGDSGRPAHRDRASTRSPPRDRRSESAELRVGRPIAIRWMRQPLRRSQRGCPRAATARRSIRCRHDETVAAVSKSAVSRRFVALSSERLEQWLASRLDHVKLPVVMIDGIHFKDRVVLVALGFDTEGKKHVLGIREGSTENTRVVRSLISDLIERGLEADDAAAVDHRRRSRRCAARSRSFSAQLRSCSAARSTNAATSSTICRSTCMRVSDAP